MLHDGLQVDLKSAQMTLEISILKDIFFMHTKTNYYHLKY